MAAKKTAPKTEPREPPKLPLSPRTVDARTLDLGRAAWPLVACAEGRGVLTSWIDAATALVDLRSWPPTLAPFVAEWTRDARRSREGTWAFLVGWKQQSVVVLRDEATLELPMPKKKLGFAAIGFASGRVVAIPGPLAHDNKSSPLGCAQTLMIESEGALVPAKTEVEEGGTAWDLCGGVTLLDGTDVVVWSGRVLAWDGARFVRHAPDLPPTPEGFGFTAVPFGDGFFCAAGKKLLFVRHGEAKHERHAEGVGDVVAITPLGDAIALTTVGPFAHHRYDPRTGKVERIDTTAIDDVDFRLFASPVGLVASANQQSQLVRVL